MIKKDYEETCHPFFYLKKLMAGTSPPLNTKVEL